MKQEPATLKPQDSENAAMRFDALVRKVLSVPHSEIMRREEEYQKTRPGLIGQKRGRKPKAQPFA
jgi:hypothetical protein